MLLVSAPDADRRYQDRLVASLDGWDDGIEFFGEMQPLINLGLDRARNPLESSSDAARVGATTHLVPAGDDGSAMFVASSDALESGSAASGSDFSLYIGSIADGFDEFPGMPYSPAWFHHPDHTGAVFANLDGSCYRADEDGIRTLLDGVGALGCEFHHDGSVTGIREAPDRLVVTDLDGTDVTELPVPAGFTGPTDVDLSDTGDLALVEVDAAGFEALVAFAPRTGEVVFTSGERQGPWLILDTGDHAALVSWWDSATSGNRAQVVHADGEVVELEVPSGSVVVNGWMAPDASTAAVAYAPNPSAPPPGNSGAAGVVVFDSGGQAVEVLHEADVDLDPRDSARDAAAVWAAGDAPTVAVLAGGRLLTGTAGGGIADSGLVDAEVTAVVVDDSSGDVLVVTVDANDGEQFTATLIPGDDPDAVASASFVGEPGSNGPAIVDLAEGAALVEGDTEEGTRLVRLSADGAEVVVDVDDLSFEETSAEELPGPGPGFGVRVGLGGDLFIVSLDAGAYLCAAGDCSTLVGPVNEPEGFRVGHVLGPIRTAIADELV